MMPNSRRKGKEGELELTRKFRAEGYDAHRSTQYCGNTGEAADVDDWFELYREWEAGRKE